MIRQYMKDEIGTEYQKWRPKDVVFLEAPTGAGKTKFILKTLLPHAVKGEKHILYLVNRRILKEQLSAEISALPSRQGMYIEIRLYQEIEQCLKEGEYNTYKFRYIICDEAHYFSSDSLFNTRTEMVYSWLRKQLYEKVIIYISATLGLVRQRIEEDWEKRKIECSPIYNWPLGVKLSPENAELKLWESPEGIPLTVQFTKERFTQGNGTNQIWGYPRKGSLEADYSYLECHVINSVTDIIKSISESKDKWLIFVDSIDKGRIFLNEIKKDLRKQKRKKLSEEEEFLEEGSSSEVVFLFSGYQEKSESLKEVSKITEDQKQRAKVLICTSVMDNGISLKDVKLKNLVIEADVKDEFLQMLGRKRETGEITKLYLVNKSKEEIDKRLYGIKQIKNLCNECIKQLHSAEEQLKMGGYERETGDEEKDKKIITVQKIECAAIWTQHGKVLSKLMEEKVEAVRQIFYVQNGCLFLNWFSVQRVEYLCQYYQELLKEMKEDEFALPRRQLGWIGKNPEEADKLINYEKGSIYQRSWEKVNNRFLEICKENEEGLTELEFSMVIRELREDLRVLIKGVEAQDPEYARTMLDTVRRNKRILSKENIEWLRKHCGLNYVEEQEGKKESKIYRLKQYKEEAEAADS